MSAGVAIMHRPIYLTSPELELLVGWYNVESANAVKYLSTGSSRCNQSPTLNPMTMARSNVDPSRM